jgi:hypothetical protein
MDRSGQSSRVRRRVPIAFSLWCALGLAILGAGLVIRQRARTPRLAELMAPLTQRAWLPVLVSGAAQAEVEARLEALTSRLSRAPGVLQVLGRRGPERLFFALRWPLYLPAADLGRVLRALREIPEAPPPAFAFELVKPALLGHTEQLNTLYAASMDASATPDGRMAAALLIAQPAQVAALREQLDRERDPGKGGARIEFDTKRARALLFGAPDPLFVDAGSAERAREIVARVRAARARDPGFALRSARSIHDYLPGDARPQLALLHAIRGFLLSSTVAALNQRQRDALRPLLPAPLRALPSVTDLPEFVRAPFRSADGRFDHLVHLLPAVGLSPDQPEHVRRVQAALTALGLSGVARGAFTVAARAGQQMVWVERLGVVWLVFALAFVPPSARAWLARARVRRALTLTFAVCALYSMLCWGASRWIAGVVARRAPALRSEAIVAFPPFIVRLERPQLSVRGVTADAERVSVRLSLPWHLTLSCEGTRLRADAFGGMRLSADVFLGRVRARSSLFAPRALSQLSLAGGELSAQLDRVDGAREELDLSGEFALEPELFGRLPLLAESADALGPFARSTTPRQVQLRGTWSAPALIGLAR